MKLSTACRFLFVCCTRLHLAFATNSNPAILCSAQTAFSAGKWGGAWYFAGQQWRTDVVLPAGPNGCTCAGYSPEWETAIWLCNDCKSQQTAPLLDIVIGLFNMTDQLGQCTFTDYSAPLSAQISMDGSGCKTPNNWHIIVGGDRASGGKTCTTCSVDNSWQPC